MKIIHCNHNTFQTRETIRK